MNFNIKLLNNIEKYKHCLIEHEFIVKQVCGISNPKNNSIMFSKVLNDDILEKLSLIKESLIIVNENQNFSLEKIKKSNLIICVENPRMEYAFLLTYMLEKSPDIRKYKDLYNNIVIGENVYIGENTIIEPGVFIDHDVIIGENCLIMTGTKIRKNVKIGDNCVLRENSVIGGQGYGIERDENGVTIRIPHLGGVIIGNNVEIGALTAIAQGTIDPTVIDDYVKIDNLVHIAHNCKIGKGSMIIACAEVSGSTEIGSNVWIAPNASIINKTKIGNNAIIGIGSVVIKDVPSSTTITGNPADLIENIKKFNKIKKGLLENNK